MNHAQFDQVAVDMRNITKVFGSLTANDNVSLTVHKGEVHALLGENGAGKTTLMNMLYGLLTPDKGEIFIHGQNMHFKNPGEAIAAGLGMVHQHFMLVQPFTVTENIILGQETLKNKFFLDKAAARKKVTEISEKYGLKIDPDAKICDISVGMQQRVEIIKALYRGAEILILDEPTAVLTPQEIDELMDIIDSLTEQGKTVIIITHKLVEIKKCADFCTIVRRGQKIDTVKVSDVTEDELAAKMVGRQVTFRVEKKPAEPGEEVISISDVWVDDVRGLPAVQGLNLTIRRGEIVGLAGVDGNGQSELIEALVGLRKVKKGKLLLKGKDITHDSIHSRIESGLGSIPQDRQKMGLVLPFTISENMILEKRGKEPFSHHGMMKYDKIKEYAQKQMNAFDVRPNNPEHLAGQLSGGNQQKVIIARVIGDDPDFIIAAQPTRGLDVGAIEAVHKALVMARDQGKAVLLVSFELDEIINVSDRIAVIYEGRLAGEIDAEHADENTLGLWMAGGKQNEE